jgi:hypothetical protein
MEEEDAAKGRQREAQTEAKREKFVRAIFCDAAAIFVASLLI